MQAIILAGGRGMRLQEYTSQIPKPLVAVGGQPIIFHVIYHLRCHGFERITIAGGYKVKQLESEIEKQQYEGVDIRVIDTGENTNSAGRLKRLASEIDDTFFLCWCDGLSDLNISAMIDQHMDHNHLVTLAAVHPPARFGELVLDGKDVLNYEQKPDQVSTWISGGYFVVEPDMLAQIPGDSSSWENDILDQLTVQRKLAAYRHQGYWQCMDTIFDKQLLDQLVESGDVMWPQP